MSILGEMNLTFPSTSTDIDTSTDFSESLSGVTNPLYRQTPIPQSAYGSNASENVVVTAQKEFEKLFPEWAGPLAAALAAAGVASSVASSGPAKVEVTAKGPATPPPATTTPPPVVVPPATTTPSVDPADPAKEVPKQEPTAEEKSLAEKLGIPAATLATLLKYGIGALASYLSYKSAKDAQEQARGVSFAEKGPVTSTRKAYQGSTYKAQGGLMTLAEGGEVSQPFYLGGVTDGMADEVPAHIDNKRPAALSDGEFVIPADVVSHLGNGNSNAGAKRLYEMMDNIREARTGNKNQGIQINPNKFMPR